MIKKADFIKRKMQLMCEICYKKIRIVNALSRELPDEGILDEMDEIFNQVIQREA